MSHDKDVLNRFLINTADHTMKIHRDDGIYRHLEFSRNGSNSYRFDLVTWPLYLSDEHIDAVLDSRGNIEYVIADKRERLRMFAREILRAASSQPENQQTRALVMWIKRLSLALRSASPDNKLPKVAMGYLQNNGLISIADCLRGNNEEPPA
ncbi:TPA: hypothetical protein ACGRNI_002931 [Klebsiella pneumoniae]